MGELLCDLRNMMARGGRTSSWEVSVTADEVNAPWRWGICSILMVAKPHEPKPMISGSDRPPLGAIPLEQSCSGLPSQTRKAIGFNVPWSRCNPNWMGMCQTWKWRSMWLFSCSVEATSGLVPLPACPHSPCDRNANNIKSESKMRRCTKSHACGARR